MHTLTSVVDDLYYFALNVTECVASFLYKQWLIYLGRTAEGMNIEAEVVEEDSGVDEPQTFKSMDALMSEKAQVLKAELSVTTMYINASDVALFKDPTYTYDGALTLLPFGTGVTVHDMKGRWADVTAYGQRGWVLRDVLVEHTHATLPLFHVGTEYNVDDPDTVCVRALIRDEFSCGRIEYPLQAGEYVLYRIMRDGKRIVWPNVRPRVPGEWHTILKGAPGIHIGVFPKVGTIMEYSNEDGVGHLAYVESLLADWTITISEANHPDNGRYSERTLTRDEWHEYRPVFIEVRN